VRTKIIEQDVTDTTSVARETLPIDKRNRIKGIRMYEFIWD